jgi:hypothetical protein
MNASMRNRNDSDSKIPTIDTYDNTPPPPDEPPKP